MTNAFHYADQGDVLTDQLIQREYDPDYWGRSEDAVLDRAVAAIRARFGEERMQSLRLLDLGCGEGRLIPRFAALLGSVTALEPDPERCAGAAGLVRKESLENAEVLNLTGGEYRQKRPGERFDVVLCSHVFQHIGFETFAGILEDIRAMANPGALFLFTTTFTAGTENVYTAEFLSEGERKVIRTDAEGFAAAVELPDVLAVCMFAKPWMERFLEKAGYGVRDFQAYHFAGETDAARDAENSALERARDAFYLCELTAAQDTEKDAPEGGALRPLCGPDRASGKVCFLHFFYVKGEHRLKQGINVAKGNDPHEREVRHGFETAEGFLYGGGLHFQTERCFFADVSVRAEGIPICESHAVLSVYPELGIAQVSVNFTVDETIPDNFVYLHQVQCARADFFEIDGEKGSIPGLCEHLLERGGLRGFRQGPTAIITELNSFGDRSNGADLGADECRCLYGILTGDEGYSHVPEALARKRMEVEWTSRDFVKVIIFSNNYVLLNLNRQEVHRDYLDTQRPYAEHFFGSLNEYFTMNAPTAGVNHGLFFSVETGMLIKTAADRLLNGMPDISQPHGAMVRDEIKRNKRYRGELIATLSRVEMVSISELGELDNLVVENLSVSKRIESIRYLLELVESDLDLLYNTNTNRMVNMLTGLGVLLALTQVILALLG